MTSIVKGRSCSPKDTGLWKISLQPRMHSRSISVEQEFKLTPGRVHSLKMPLNLTQPSLDGSMMATAGHMSGQLFHRHPVHAMNLSNVDARKVVRPVANVFVQH